MACEVKNCVFASHKSIIKTESGEKNAQIKHCLQAKTVQNKYVIGFWC